MHPLARRRATGYLLDCTGYLGIAAAMVPFGLVVNALTDLGPRRSSVTAVSAIPPAIATVLAACAESGPRRATWGKRRSDLEVTAFRKQVLAGAGDAQDGVAPGPVASGQGAHGAPITVGQGLIRNTVKIFVPWQLGHLTTIGTVYGDFETMRPGTVTVSVLTYGLIGAFVVMGLRGSGRGPHDLAGGTVVVLSAAATPPRSR
ncbi:MAG: hypothetical protein L0G94_03480 [Brachybacterium sp.]|uniref:hypothetical protein n=1 Tax=Brachybacterium sp. TaxID=1891286 RepID=UPI00264A2A4D|nr:hypothetical protein [Brachybacterium sp.]MDN5685732.1 hypothetical protein [Brachybacterium sp.]